MKCAMSERLVRLGISMAQLNIMYTLQRDGEMTMSRLADVLNVSLSNATGLVDRMEERGFVERTRVPEDRRVVLVRITPAGTRVIEENDALHGRRCCATSSIAWTRTSCRSIARRRRRSSGPCSRPRPACRGRIAIRPPCPLHDPARPSATTGARLAPDLTPPDQPPQPRRDTPQLMESFPAEYGTSPSLDDDPALGLSHRAKMEILFAVMLGLFLGALDQTIVGPALPTIVTQLNGNDYYVWAITIYLLTSTISVPFWGKLSDLYGRKPIYMLGIVIFLVGSALSGLSQNMGMLILFRGIQGIGAGALFPVALAIIGDLFTPQERGKYQGLFGAVFGIAFVAGPLIGGFLTENWGWHWIFYVNIPIGIVALIVIQRLLPTVKTEGRQPELRHHRRRDLHRVDGLPARRPDQQGLTNATTHQLSDWTEPTVGGFILVGIIGTLLFIVAESRAKEPIIPLDLWKSRTYSASMVSTFFAAFAFFGAIVFLPRWFQVVEGFSPTNSGLAALPLMIGLIGSSIVSGLVVSRTGRYKWLLVGAIATMGVATLLMTQLTKDTPVPVVWLWMFIAGLGVGPTFSVFTIVIQNAVPFRQLGVATSNLTFFRQIGGTVALAFVGTIFGTTFSEELPKQIIAAGVPPNVLQDFGAGSGHGQDRLRTQLTGVGDLGETSIDPRSCRQRCPFIDQVVEGIHGAFSLATAQTFWLGVVGSVIAVAAAVAIKEIPLRVSNAEPAYGEAPAAGAAPVTSPAPVGSAAQAAQAQARPRWHHARSDRRLTVERTPHPLLLGRRPRWHRRRGLRLSRG